MRLALPLISLALLAALPLASAANVSDPYLTNQILRVTSTPQLAPGERGNITLVLHNPYNSSMGAPSLRAEIYRYVSNRESVGINASIPTPIFATTGGTRFQKNATDIADFAPTESRAFDLGILTTPSVLHGGVFDQGTYLVRFRFDFNLNGSRRIMVSLGHFTREEWRAARSPAPGVNPSCLEGDANYCYLGALLGLSRIDGILPDTSFGVREALPSWPFYLLGISSGLLAVGAVAAFVLEHPGRYPRLEGGLRRLLRRGPAKPL